MCKLKPETIGPQILCFSKKKVFGLLCEIVSNISLYVCNGTKMLKSHLFMVIKKQINALFGETLVKTSAWQSDMAHFCQSLKSQRLVAIYCSLLIFHQPKYLLETISLSFSVSAMEAIFHSSSFLLPSIPADETRYALVVLNQNLPRFTPLLWEHGTFLFFFPMNRSFR